MTYGYVQTTCNVCMLVGGPIIGWICDKKGANVGVVCTLVGGAISYFIQAVAWNLPVLFLSKVPWVFLHTMHCAQVCVSHLSTNHRRSEALGRLAMSYGVGMVAGTALGGFLGDLAGYQTNSWVACVVSLASVPLIFLFVPTHALLQPDKDCSNSKGRLPLPVIFELLTQPHILSLTVNSALVAFANGLHRYTFPNVMLHYFLLKSSDQGFILAMGATVATISNIILVGPALLVLGGERPLVLAMIMILGLCMVLYSFARPGNLWFLYASILPNSAADAVLFTIFTSLFTYSVPSQQVGTALAIAHAVSTASGIVMPLIGNYIYVTYGFVPLSLVAAATFALAFVHGVSAIGLRQGHPKDTEQTPLYDNRA